MIVQSATSSGTLRRNDVWPLPAIFTLYQGPDRPSGRQTADPQPAGLRTRRVEAGLSASLPAGRRGRGMSSPPQLGQMPPRRSSAQGAQKVHSKEQMRASGESGRRSLSQHSQLGRSSSTMTSAWCGRGSNDSSGRRMAAVDGPLTFASPAVRRDRLL